MNDQERRLGRRSRVGWLTRKFISGPTSLLQRDIFDDDRRLFSIHCGSTTFGSGKHLARGLWLLVMTVCAACQSGPVLTSKKTTNPTPTLVSTSTPLPDESSICQSHETSEYVLPFPVGHGYTCIQGYVGRTYHVGVFKYGLDFDMPMGALVTAAREGQVIFIEASHSDRASGTENANVVIVLHEDGTFGRYVHLTQDGVLVDVGDSVAKGDPIGLSGSSGDPWMPHLHFDVTEDCSQPNCRTIPVCFSNTQPHPAGLVTHEYYLAGSY
jgi:hypothetical protein